MLLRCRLSCRHCKRRSNLRTSWRKECSKVRDGGKRERERVIMIRMHKTIRKLRILYSNYNTQETNQKPKSSEKEMGFKLSVFQYYAWLFQMTYNSLYQRRYDHVNN